ncbi:hypothetical protein Acsp04_45410 [Actinomadura sp. NBRC 104425]|uniref:DUF1707 and DUF4870 domain-containing protein n=1 Tax=Actinomadura sp. NBRC 104425 TaxID=3032204 RepID=UPI00249F9621|nr:DUF1707 and DUF4870 domain-containing protein [Actinomadura sp. NBRC 104425]GLZ14306.1 hypothetical protein Acsp04_45410 [Actinomadura sp. NBRC 104425]
MDSTFATGDLRVSDAEREQVVARLQDAYAEGRLEHAEFDMRMHLAMTAKTRSDLATVMRDLTPGPGLPEAEGEPTGEERVVAALAHFTGVLTLFVAPLVLMLVCGRKSQYVRRHAAEAVNFQLTVLAVTVLTFGVGAMLYSITWVVAGVAAVHALVGRPFRHPWILRPVK